MPSYPPRQKPVKKQEELSKRKMELVFAIKKNISVEKLLILADKYRQVQLSMIKAKIHLFKENEYQKKPNQLTLEQLEKQKIAWGEKTNEKIIYEVKKSTPL